MRPELTRTNLNIFCVKVLSYKGHNFTLNDLLYVISAPLTYIRYGILVVTGGERHDMTLSSICIHTKCSLR